MTTTEWRRVSKARPCPICGRPDWCLYTGAEADPTAVICPRIESSRRAGEAGWLHRLRDAGAGPRRTRTIQLSAPAPDKPQGGPDLAAMAARWRLPADSPRLQRLAESLGVSTLSLAKLATGWAHEYKAWTFPMRDAAGRVVGVRLRRLDGRKLSVRGGREGLFFECLPQGGRILLCEGPTDCAALLDLGFPAVGRPSCAGGTRHVLALLRRLQTVEAVIVADGDTPGLFGAEGLAAVLLPYCAVRVIAPPKGFKDAREWRNHGARPADLESAIASAPVRRLTIESQRRGGARHG